MQERKTTSMLLNNNKKRSIVPLGEYCSCLEVTNTSKNPGTKILRGCRLLWQLPRQSERASRWLSGKESACQCRRHRRCGFHPWVGKMPWRRKWQPTPVFSPGKFHRLRSLAGCSLRGHKEWDVTEQACIQSE